MMRQRWAILSFFAVMSLTVSCTFLNTPDDGKPNIIPATDELKCERQPTATVVDNETTGTDNPCEATAKIQAIAYECGDPTDTVAFQKKAYELNVEQAQKRCTQFCRARGESCEGAFSAPGDCGLKTPPSKALDFGKNVMHCQTKCKGQAFNYCSIYHGNFLSTSDPKLFANARSNCRCFRK